MAKSESAIDPKDQFKILETPTVQPEIPDRRGPLIYDVSMTPSLNGVDPYYQKKDGV